MSVEPIDAVVTWVDGSDPVWVAKRAQYLGLSTTNEIDFHSRYVSEDEIFYCIASLLQFAPFLRKIHIVTDQQVPDIFDRLKTIFGDAIDKIVLVDHTTIFAGFESYLPVFNSISIETMLSSIPGLAEQFVYFNDDVFLTKPSRRSDFFKNERPVLRGKWQSVYPVILRNRLENFLVNTGLVGIDTLRVSSKLTQFQGAKQVSDASVYFWHGHTPLAFRKSVLFEFFTKNPDAMKSNIATKTRNRGQFNISSLAFALELLERQPPIAPLDLVYINPEGRRNMRDYLIKKLNAAQNKDVKFLCVQSLSRLSDDNIQFVKAWLDQTILKHD